VEDGTEIDIPTLRNQLMTLVAQFVNLAGFYYVLGISYELDSITNIETGESQVFGVEGHVFDDTTEFKGQLTFSSVPPGAPLAVGPEELQDQAVSRATFELRNAIRYPDYTELHCKLAIEAIKNAFGQEKHGWASMRSSLNLETGTLNLFKSASDDQRHGRTLPQSWPQRKQAMQVAWEVVNRYLRWKAQGEPTRGLPKHDYPPF
jgi:hypothetical protein